MSERPRGYVGVVGGKKSGTACAGKQSIDIWCGIIFRGSRDEGRFVAASILQPKFCVVEALVGEDLCCYSSSLLLTCLNGSGESPPGGGIS